jgi:hypothetical protein
MMRVNSRTAPIVFAVLASLTIAAHARAHAAPANLV